METIDINEVFAQANVVENLKNFAGIDAQNALGMMSPERLAAVVGESQRESNSYSFTISNKRWYRIFKFYAQSYGLFFLSKIWASGEPAMPLVAFNRHDVSVLLRTENTGNNILKARIMKDDRLYYLDLWYETDNETRNAFTAHCIEQVSCTYMNAEPIEDTTSTLIKEISLV